MALEHGLVPAAMRAYNNLQVVLEGQDRFAELADLSSQQLDLARRVGDRAWELQGLGGQGGVLIMLGRWDEARSAIDELRAAEEVANLEAAGGTALELTSLRVHQGDVGGARVLLDSLAWVGRSEDWQARALHSLSTAGVLRAEGRPAEALAAAEEVLAARAKVGSGWRSGFAKNALVASVEAALDLGNHERVQELLAMVAAALPGQVSPWIRAQVARLTARLAAATGDIELVEPGFEAAESGFRELQTPFFLAVTLTEHSEWLASRGRQDQSMSLQAEAREIFERLRARPWLDRLGTLVNSASVPA